ncbi:MAG TPA: hypothetical protein VFR55_02555 [Dehalococcoidia bacterium]|nr:hypothetical protein [Dehalococcoidia bacterium]
MEQLVLTAQVVRVDEGYVARLEELELEGSGESIQEAQDELVDNLRDWIETQEVGETLEQALRDAGFSGVDENTEIQLEFTGLVPE